MMNSQIINSHHYEKNEYVEQSRTNILRNHLSMETNLKHMTTKD